MIQSTYSLLCFGVILNGGAANPTCELDDGILLVGKQIKHFWPHAHILHIFGIVYGFNELQDETTIRVCPWPQTNMERAVTHHLKIVHRHDPFAQVLFLIDRNGQLLPHCNRFRFAHDMVQDSSVKLLLLNWCRCSRGRCGGIRLRFGSYGCGSRIGSLSIGSLLSAPVQELLKGVGHFGNKGLWLMVGH